jgi:hypothetical protein
VPDPPSEVLPPLVPGALLEEEQAVAASMTPAAKKKMVRM